MVVIERWARNEEGRLVQKVSLIGGGGRPQRPGLSEAKEAKSCHSTVVRETGDGGSRLQLVARLAVQELHLLAAEI
jgi:hypothetical protein